MPDEIFKPFTGKQIIKVDGVCYEWFEFSPNANETGGAITEEHDQCSDCSPDVKLYEYAPCVLEFSSSSSSVVVPFPAACAGCGSAGDVHWVFGDPTALAIGVTNASFNVDDNISNNEIVWFAFTEGATTYSIKYSQQDFDYTVGGKSINLITITETGQSDIVYSLTPSQDGTLKNGAGFGGSDSFVIGNNVAQVSISERIIDSSSNCCIPPGDSFGMLGLDVHFQDGLYNTDSVGGALWYIWKTAKDEVSLANNLSMEGIDGIGDYLNTGGTGFSARSSFEGNSQLEATDTLSLQEVSSRMTELQSLTGSWDADWDPVAEEPYECPVETCGPATSLDPTIMLTMQWTDPDVTKNYLGCTWCNGETKEVFTNDYTGSIDSTWTGRSERWRRQFGSAVSGHFELHVFATTNTAGTCPTESALVHLNHASDPDFSSFRHNVQAKKGGFPCSAPPCVTCTGFINQVTNCTIANGPLAWGIDGNPSIKDNQFTSLTTSNGVTFTWARGSGW